jgi:hypothetical protein
MAKLGPFKDPIPRDTLKQVSAVAPKVEIRSIQLVQSNCTVDDVTGPTEGETESKHRVTFDYTPDGLLAVRVQFTLNGKPVGGGKNFLSILATFRLLYESTEPEESDLRTFPKDQMDAFIHTNAVHNAWPYWREFAQNLTVRAGLPPLTLPLLKLRKAPKAQEQRPEVTQAKS